MDEIVPNPTKGYIGATICVVARCVNAARPALLTWPDWRRGGPAKNKM